MAAEIKAQHQRNVYSKAVKRVRTALDSLQSTERKEHEGNEMSLDLYSEADELLDVANNGNSSDSSGNGTRFSKYTGIFRLDFPPSPKVSKGKGKESWPIVTEQCKETDSDVTTVMPTQTQELTVTVHQGTTSDSDVVIQSLGFITECRKGKRRKDSPANVSKGQPSNASKKMKGIGFFLKLCKLQVYYVCITTSIHLYMFILMQFNYSYNIFIMS